MTNGFYDRLHPDLLPDEKEQWATAFGSSMSFGLSLLFLRSMNEIEMKTAICAHIAETRRMFLPLLGVRAIFQPISRFTRWSLSRK
jgi:hypothetical protein